jgi:hypothetical protein
MTDRLTLAATKANVALVRADLREMGQRLGAEMTVPD